MTSTMLHTSPDLTLADQRALSDLTELIKEFGLENIEASIQGGERGYNQNADVLTQTADGSSLNRMWREFQETIRLWNRDRNFLVQLLTYTVGDPTERVMQPSEEDFEEASEFGEPKGIRLGTPFILGFPFKWFDLAIRYTWMFLAEASADQVRELNNTALEADNRLMFTRVLRAIFNATNETATINGQAVNVYRFYNNDGTVPPKWKNTTHAGTHTHYITSGAATVDAGDLTDMENHLKHHGYDINRGYDLVLLVNSAQGATIRTFKVGVGGATYDFIPSQGVGGGVFLPANGGIVARPGGRNIPGLIGTYGPWLVVEEDYIPAGYMFGFATAGERNIGNPVGIREHQQPGLRGLRLVKGREPDYPLIDSFYQHGFGAGIRHRGAGIVMQVTASASYTAPAAYA